MGDDLLLGLVLELLVTFILPFVLGIAYEIIVMKRRRHLRWLFPLVCLILALVSFVLVYFVQGFEPQMYMLLATFFGVTGAIASMGTIFVIGFCESYGNFREKKKGK